MSLFKLSGRSILIHLLIQNFKANNNILFASH